jgi:hypothetical protein
MENMVTAKQIAKAAGIAPATRHFVLRDELGLAYDGSRTAHVLAALARIDKTPGLPAGVRTAAYATWKCLITARMNPTLSLRVQAYSPYRVCALVAQIHTANPDAQIGELADFWINEHAKEL